MIGRDPDIPSHGITSNQTARPATAAASSAVIASTIATAEMFGCLGSGKLNIFQADQPCF